MRDILHSGLVDEQSLRVRIAALEAAANFLQVIEEPTERLQFQELNPTMLNVVSAALNDGDEESARNALELFVEFAEIDPTFLKPHLDMFVNAMITIATSELEAPTQQLGVEFLVTLAENKPGMCRRMPKFVETMLPVLLRMMLEIEDDEAWFVGDDDEDDQTEVRNCDVGEQGLDRLSIALGGKAIVPQLFAVLPNLLGNADWRQRHTALMSVSVIGEGCSKVMMPYMAEIIKTIAPYFGDEHPRVRWAACNSFGQLCTDFGPDFQKQFHADMVPNLCALMGNDVQYPRVQSHAAAAMINFCEGADADLVGIYLQELLTKMMGLLQSQSAMCQEQAVTAIAAIADCVKDKFAPYYSTFVPPLKDLLHASANQKELRNLRGKVMECVTLIGVAVGRDQFRDDARDLMEIMLATQSSEMASDDPQLKFVLQSWARICRCLQQEFVPYLAHVMPPLLRSASVNPEVSISDIGAGGAGVSTSTMPLTADMAAQGIVHVTESDGDGGQGGHGGQGGPAPLKSGEGWDVMVVGDKRISIHTSSLEEKSTACNMLYCYAAELEEGFYNYVDPVARLLVPLMKFYFHDGVRSAAWTAMPALMQCVRMHAEKAAEASGQPDNADRSGIATFFEFVFTPFLEAVFEESELHDIESLEVATEALGQFIATTGPGVIRDVHIAQCIRLAATLRQLVMERRKSRHEEAQGEDHDEEAQETLEAMDENDADVLLQVGELVGQLARHAPGDFLAVFSQSELPQLINEMLASPVARDRHVALCIFDDMMEHLNTHVLGMLDSMLPHWIHAAADPHDAVRQAGVFGLGLAAQFGENAVTPHVPQIFQTLQAVIEAPGSREGGAANCTENAVAAVGKVLQFQAANCGVPIESLLPLWLSWFPMAVDEVESKISYAQFCTFLEDPTYSAIMLGGEELVNLPKIYEVLGAAYRSDFTDDNLDTRLLALFVHMQATYPDHVTQAALAALPVEHQQNLLSNQ
jgi:importin-5